MKANIYKQTILVGIDYTKSSENALEYAIMMAAKANASVLLFHMYETPVIHTFSGAYFISYSEMQGYNQSKLEKYKDKVSKKHPRTHIETFATYKFFKVAANELIRSRKIHYVVLGLEAKSRLSKFIYGSTGVDIAGKINCPVIIVPEKYKDHKMNKVIMAIDNNKSISPKVMQKAEKFSKQFKTRKELVHFKTPDEFLFIQKRKAESSDKKWNVKVVESENFQKGIFAYVKSNNVDLISIISHSHSLMYNFFNETNTKLIAFNSRVPVMSIHG